jgi:hypothetical protein
MTGKSDSGLLSNVSSNVSNTSFPRQIANPYQKHLTILKNCEDLQPNHAILASKISAILSFDLSNCRILNEIISINPVVLYFRKNHFLIESFNEKLSLYKSAGLIEFFITLYSKKSFASNGQTGPKVLTVFDLSGGFKVWFFGLAIATSVFLLEKLVNRMKHRPSFRESFLKIRSLDVMNMSGKDFS